jgi:LPS export ABC transporter permease LptG
VDLYVARQLVAPGAVVLITFASMLLMQLLLREARTIFSETTTPVAVFQFVLYRIPWFLVLSLPVAMMGATSLALARLIRDRELAAMGIAGISLRRLAIPILLVSLLVALFSFLINEELVPWANKRALMAQGRAFYQGPYTAVPTSQLVFEGRPGLDLYVRSLNTRAGQARDIVCFETDANGSPVACLISPRATFSGKTWILFDVKEYSFDASGQVKEGITRQPEVVLQLQQDVQTALGIQASAEQMSALQLKERISAVSSGGLEGANELELALHRRFSVPFACVVLALLMIPVTVRFAGGSTFGGLLLAIFIYFLYNGLMNWAKAVAEADLMNPVVAAWLHDVVFGLVALFLFARRG